MTNIEGLTRMRTTSARRRALGLLAALAVTLGAVAAPPAGTAHAGGLAGGVVNGRDPVAATVDADRSTPEVGRGHAAAPGGDPGAGAGTIDPAGSKLGIAGGSN